MYSRQVKGRTQRRSVNVSSIFGLLFCISEEMKFQQLLSAVSVDVKLWGLVLKAFYAR